MTHRLVLQLRLQTTCLLVARPRIQPIAVYARPQRPPPAAAFAAVDLFLQLTMRGVAARLLRPYGASGNAMVSPGDVTKALIIAVSFIHLGIQVSCFQRR